MGSPSPWPCGLVVTKGSKIRYANAGHPPILIASEHGYRISGLTAFLQLDALTRREMQEELLQLWDEARHAMMGEVGFTQLGVDWPRQVMINHTWSLALNSWGRVCHRSSTRSLPSAHWVSPSSAPIHASNSPLSKHT